MKIQRILNEGIIKVPQDTVNQAMTIACARLFQIIFDYLDRVDEPDLLDIYTKFFKQVQSKYGRIKLGEGYRIIYLRMNELSKSYLSRNPKARGRTYGISMNVLNPDGENGSDGEYSKRGKDKSVLNIYLPSVDNVQKIARSPELFSGIIERLEGIITHELMHAVQDLALDQLDTAEIQSYYKGKELDFDKYYNSAVEFGPQILSAAKEFIANIKDLKALNVPMSQENIRSNLNRFVNPTAPEPSGVQGMRSNFFDALYAKDKTKWKKAVKYFHGLVSDKIKELA